MDVLRKACKAFGSLHHEEDKRWKTTSTDSDSDSPSDSFRSCEGFHIWGIPSKSRCFEAFRKYIDTKTSVIDVGCGDGVATRLLADRLEPKYICALEPGFEHDFSAARSFLEPAGIHVENTKIQHAIYRPKYAQTFDVATVFKYNAPFLEKDSFAYALSRVIRPGGVVLITVVEHDRMCFGYGYDPALYIGFHLRTYFSDVELKEINHGGSWYEGLIVCKDPL